jgi:Lhr-like helicase
MRAFSFDQHVLSKYRDFSRSFTRLRAPDLSDQVEKAYAAGTFWPEPLLSINPSYERGATAAELAGDGLILSETADVFRLEETPLTFHVHQEQAISKAASGRSFVVTTGTGSGKSLCFFVPIIDAAIRARMAGDARRTRAVIVYPMNALANSQIEEIEKFLGQSGLPDHLRPTVARYTGQERDDERRAIAADPPDILLTNFMMLELLMTRQDDVDRAVVANAQGLGFVVLDELHTYRGRQGADVAVLVRRLKERCREDTDPICIGTSATMATEGDEGARATAVARVASRLFGAEIGPDAVIDESLRRATDPDLTLEAVTPQLEGVLTAPFPGTLTRDDLRGHPLAVWLELAVGLEDGKDLRRRRPRAVGEIAAELADAAGVPEDLARAKLEEFLALISSPEEARGGTGKDAFMAFKLHRFIAGAGDVLTTLRAQPRRVLFEGQKTDPKDPEARLYPTRFCRACGQEYHVVTLAQRDEALIALPRQIDETPVEGDDDGDEAGYLTPCCDADDEFRFTGEIDTFPEDWLEERGGTAKLRSNRRKSVPRRMSFRADGAADAEGREFWFIPGRFGFCLACGDQPVAQARERNKLAGLTAEGRSSATTTLVSGMLEALNAPESEVPEAKRKTLGFTDNRQDAALQAGHFNDTVFVSLLRGAILRAVIDAGEDGLEDEAFGRAVQKALGFLPEREGARHYWMLTPEVKGSAREQAGRSLAKVLAHRVWADQRRGWRFTYPNLTGLDLVRPEFAGLSELLDELPDRDEAPAVLRALDRDRQEKCLRRILETMLEGLAVDAEALDADTIEPVAQRSRSLLTPPWALDASEELRKRTALVLEAPPRRQTSKRDAMTLLRGGFRSGLGRDLNRASVLGRRLRGEEFDALVAFLLGLLEEFGIVGSVTTSLDVPGWQLSAASVRLCPGPAVANPDLAPNRFFHDLYAQIARDLDAGTPPIAGFEAREHTAQVSQQHREWREWRFRATPEDVQRVSEAKTDIQAAGEKTTFLPTLFCSPTMELGVDISALNAVYLRNVPPTPANYAQRAGRAGRSGQAAVITTYCAAQSPHDQYYFRRRRDMVAGIVKPPALDLANEDLLRSHLHAVWLALSGQQLAPDIPDVLDLSKEGAPVREEIASALGDADLARRAVPAMRRVLEAVLPHIEPPVPDGLKDPDAFVAEVAQNAPRAFDAAFARWRGLYNAAQKQLHEANTRSEQTGLPGDERRKVKQAQAQANEQISLLEQGRAGHGSDFYTYRYLATEGFLPGYNFPRLPLYAYVPGPGRERQGSFLQRARFLAISEFGPRSLIYHEGRAYRVHRAKLGAEAIGSDGRSLATQEIHVCPACGGAHREEVERCHACDGPMAGATPIRRTLRIDNVETLPAERITANDEERQRQGFEILTVFSWPWRRGRLDMQEAHLETRDGRFATLQYAEGAQISRLNLGLRRRKEKTLHGFQIDPTTGNWTRLPDEADPTAPDEEKAVRIVPVVQDNKNALLLRIADPDSYAPEAITTLQHALLRGIEIVFQLEEGEVLGDPLPTRDDRRAILIYEATEGGAGVLSRLIRDADAVRQVAAAALGVMHFDNVDAAIAAGDAAHLQDHSDAPCVHGCYRCLLSYYNQPDHEAIDRTDEDTLTMLIAMATARMTRGTGTDATRSGGWATAFADGGLPQPDREPLEFAGHRMAFVWRSEMVAATLGEVPDEVVTKAAAAGWELVCLPDDGACVVPDELIRLLGETA